jgi:hypothetical protein
MIDTSTLLTCRSTSSHWRTRDDGWLRIDLLTDKHLINVVTLLRSAAKEAVVSRRLEDKDRQGILLNVDTKNPEDLIHQVHPGYGTMLLELAKRHINISTLTSMDKPTFPTLLEHVECLTERVFALEQLYKEKKGRKK